MSAPALEVFVRDGEWPTFAEVNAALTRRGYRMAVMPQAGQAENDPLFPHNYTFKVRSEMDGQVEEEYLEEAGAVRFERDWQGEFNFNCQETNETLEQCGSPYRVAPGDYVLQTGFLPDESLQYDFGPVLLSAIMIKDFGGYGFEIEEANFGREDFADRMLDRIAPYVKPEGETPPVALPPVALSVEPLPEAQKPKSRWGYWRIILIILLLLLAAEFVDKNIYNFTGTGG